jgi:hypothetical protein
MTQAASGGRSRQRHDRGAGPDGSGRQRSVPSGPLLDQIDGKIVRVTADGAYDGDPTYETNAAYGDDIEVVIPPYSTAVPSDEPGLSTLRDLHLAMISERGRLAWQAAPDYAQRSLIETTMGCYKALIGPRLRARGFDAQQTEAAIGVAVLNPMLAVGRPKSVCGPRQRMTDHDRGHLELHQASAPVSEPGAASACISCPRGPAGREQPVVHSCPEHQRWTCALAGWPRRMPSRKSRLSRHRKPSAWPTGRGISWCRAN